MRRKFATWLVGKNVQMGRVSEGLEDARVIDLSVLADALDRKARPPKPSPSRVRPSR
jgi:hypothetical protein